MSEQTEWICKECEADNYLCSCTHHDTGKVIMLQRWYFDKLIKAETLCQQKQDRIGELTDWIKKQPYTEYANYAEYKKALDKLLTD